eukprot:TRINITY_DN24822_c0_g1_i1.p1 TRINITY_DN24822_c0_g1~~TRINITY_DN24822_c0_g1_i1.p1  ORF type:complete len:235 (-),score=49.80 TRINITY_DN24822_c0_g1_i1:257-961(-)
MEPEKTAKLSQSRPSPRSFKHWSRKEDAFLRLAVHEFGLSNWKLISQMVETRSSHACYQRWRRNLCHESTKCGMSLQDILKGNLFSFKSKSMGEADEELPKEGGLTAQSLSCPHIRREDEDEDTFHGGAIVSSIGKKQIEDFDDQSWQLAWTKFQGQKHEKSKVVSSLSGSPSIFIARSKATSLSTPPASVGRRQSIFPLQLDLPSVASEFEALCEQKIASCHRLHSFQSSPSR